MCADPIQLGCGPLFWAPGEIRIKKNQIRPFVFGVTVISGAKTPPYGGARSHHFVKLTNFVSSSTRGTRCRRLIKGRLQLKKVSDSGTKKDALAQKTDGSGKKNGRLGQKKRAAPA